MTPKLQGMNKKRADSQLHLKSMQSEGRLFRKQLSVFTRYLRIVAYVIFIELHF